jgi:tetratricopeptide (TPR) repeat protein
MRLQTIIRCLAITLAAIGSSVRVVLPATLDDGAGPVTYRVTACLIAERSQTAPKCEIPVLPGNATAAELAAAHARRALFFADLQRFRDAASEMDEALKLDRSADLLHLSARIAFGMRQYDRAGRDVAAALQLAPADPRIRATHAGLRALLGDTDAALTEFNTVLREHPGQLYALRQRAQILLSTGEIRAALDDLDVALALDEADIDTRLLRAQARMTLGRYGAAVDDLSAALEREPRRLDLVTARAQAYDFAGDDAKALSDYTAVLGPPGGKPLYAIAGDLLGRYLMRRALIFVRTKQFDAAATDMMKAIEAGGTSAVLRVEVYLRQHGFPDIALDGRASDALLDAIRACFRLDACSQELVRHS